MPFATSAQAPGPVFADRVNRNSWEQWAAISIACLKPCPKWAYRAVLWRTVPGWYGIDLAVLSPAVRFAPAKMHQHAIVGDFDPAGSPS